MHAWTLTQLQDGNVLVSKQPQSTAPLAAARSGKASNARGTARLNCSSAMAISVELAQADPVFVVVATPQAVTDVLGINRRGLAGCTVAVGHRQRP